MNVEQALHHAEESEAEGLRGVYPTAAQVLAEEVKALRKKSEAVLLLRDLATALDGAFISTWQTTSAWQKELDAALEYMRGDA